VKIAVHRAGALVVQGGLIRPVADILTHALNQSFQHPPQNDYLRPSKEHLLAADGAPQPNKATTRKMQLFGQSVDGRYGVMMVQRNILEAGDHWCC